MFHFSHSAVIIIKINGDLCLYKSLPFHHLYPSATFHFNGHPLLLRTFKLQLYMAVGSFMFPTFIFPCLIDSISYPTCLGNDSGSVNISMLPQTSARQAGPVFPFLCFPATVVIYSVVQQTQSSLVDSFGFTLVHAIIWIGQKVHLSFHAHIGILSELFGQPSTCFKMISS